MSNAAKGELTTGAGLSLKCLLSEDVDFSSMFSPPKASTSFTPSPPPYSDFLEFEHSPPPFVMQHHQDLINRHVLCLTRLRERDREVESLRQENAALRSFNSELNSHLRFLAAQASLQKRNCLASSSSDYNTTMTSPFGLSDDFRNFANGISGGGGGGGGGGTCGDELCEDESPTSVMDTERVSLPKSISVRSNGYLKMSPQQPVATASSKTRDTTRPRTTSSLNGGHKVYVRGGKKEEEPLELEVYNQGMFKTELCNKWQETGACPYGDHCQFAHGIEELRPVIRHPRYKTEVCRMVLAGDICPYGHRCHFRHALTEQERYSSHLKLRALKLDR